MSRYGLPFVGLGYHGRRHTLSVPRHVRRVVHVTSWTVIYLCRSPQLSAMIPTASFRRRRRSRRSWGRRSRTSWWRRLRRRIPWRRPRTSRATSTGAMARNRRERCKQLQAGGFQVLGGHTYSRVRSFPVSVTIHHSRQHRRAQRRERHRTLAGARNGCCADRRAEPDHCRRRSPVRRPRGQLRRSQPVCRGQRLQRDDSMGRRRDQRRHDRGVAGRLPDHRVSHVRVPWTDPSRRACRGLTGLDDDGSGARGREPGTAASEDDGHLVARVPDRQSRLVPGPSPALPWRDDRHRRGRRDALPARRRGARQLRCPTRAMPVRRRRRSDHAETDSTCSTRPASTTRDRRSDRPPRASRSTQPLRR